MWTCPDQAHLVSLYSNLMWSCARCNETKSDYPEPGRAVGERRVIKVDEENPRAHLELAGDTETLKHRTPTGEFNIQLLRLNRRGLTRLRSIWRRLSDSRDYIAHGISELMKVGLDLVDVQHRSVLLRLQKGVEREHGRATATVRELIEAAAKSELLDSDPNHEADLKARRDYLRSVGAIGPGLVTVPKPEKRRKPRQKKSRAQSKKKSRARSEKESRRRMKRRGRS